MERSYSWVNSKLTVKETPHTGLGVFTARDIQKNEILVVLGGYIYDINDENKLHGFNEDKPIEISEHFSFCPHHKNDMDRMFQHYLNHSCEPNVGFRGQLFMVAMRDIVAGEELCYDYAMIMHSNEKSAHTFSMKCLCGTTSCRGEVKEDDWKRPELQNKYDGYFQYYLQEKIKNPGKELYIVPDDFYKE